jgi:uncharacterized iron-regulated membrane protein
VKTSIIIRKVHYWVSIGIAVPALVLMISGVLLQVKKQWSWVQPPEQRGTGQVPQITLDSLMQSLVGASGVGVRSWSDVNRVDIRPSKGVAKVWLHDGYEVQVDLGTGAVLQHAYRRSDLIESIHDGSFFAGDWTKLGLFLPTGALLVLMLASGVVLFWVPILAKRRRRAQTRAQQSSRSA